MLKFSTLTDEYARIPTRGRYAGADIVPTGYTASVAFVLGTGNPTSGDWGSGDWETDATVTPHRYWVLRKVTTLAAGDYRIWVKLVTGNETVVRDVGVLRIT